MGTLHWAPRDFWEATYYEISCAYVGHLRGTGALKDWWGQDDIDAIEDLKRRFPDKKPPKESQAWPTKN